MDIERQFEDLGVDAITGIQLMRSLGLNGDDFYDDVRFMRFKDIIDYFKDVPDRDYLLNMITIGKNVDRVDHVWGYTQLMKQKNQLQKSIDSEQKKYDILSTTEDELAIKQQEGVLTNFKTELYKTDEQIGQYAK